ncbi:hypothetical protein PSCLAVI8L_130404 [Pseudoclavibacter sp. 8L]|nr:hypothetical protein PSCLAVI8L_130404 [Pseudoclavibacter sp. 8L]
MFLTIVKVSSLPSTRSQMMKLPGSGRGRSVRAEMWSAFSIARIVMRARPPVAETPSQDFLPDRDLNIVSPGAASEDLRKPASLRASSAAAAAAWLITSGESASASPVISLTLARDSEPSLSSALKSSVPELKRGLLASDPSHAWISPPSATWSMTKTNGVLTNSPTTSVGSSKIWMRAIGVSLPSDPGLRAVADRGPGRLVAAAVVASGVGCAKVAPVLLEFWVLLDDVEVIELESPVVLPVVPGGRRSRWVWGRASTERPRCRRR